MPKAESQTAPGEEMPSEESTGTLARLDLVAFPFEHLCYFKLSVQRGKRKKEKKKKKSTFHLQMVQ